MRSGPKITDIFVQLSGAVRCYSAHFDLRILICAFLFTHFDLRISICAFLFAHFDLRESLLPSEVCGTPFIYCSWFAKTRLDTFACAQAT